MYLCVVTCIHDYDSSALLSPIKEDVAFSNICSVLFYLMVIPIKHVLTC